MARLLATAVILLAAGCLTEARLAHSDAQRLGASHVALKTAAGDGPHKLPEQGYEGKDVRHQNMKSITSDWGGEYGPTTQKPWHSGARSSSSTLAAVLAAVAIAL